MDKYQIIQDLQLLDEEQRVIIRTNENENFKVGNLIGFQKVGVKDRPVVRITKPLKDYGKKLICAGGIIIPYSNEMDEFLNFMPPKKQWEILSKIKLMLSTIG